MPVYLEDPSYEFESYQVVVEVTPRGAQRLLELMDIADQLSITYGSITLHMHAAPVMPDLVDQIEEMDDYHEWIELDPEAAQTVLEGLEGGIRLPIGLRTDYIVAYIAADRVYWEIRPRNATTSIETDYFMRDTLEAIGAGVEMWPPDWMALLQAFGILRGACGSLVVLNPAQLVDRVGRPGVYIREIQIACAPTDWEWGVNELRNQLQLIDNDLVLDEMEGTIDLRLRENILVVRRVPRLN